jgi:putative transposase
LAGGKKIEEVCKSLTISPATYHRWQEQYGGADVNTVKELKALQEENGKLKKLVADLSLDKVALQELLEGKW